MNRIYFISIITLFFAPMSFAQKVYSVEYQNQADVKVFVVDYENQADLKVYKVKYQNQADLKIYFVKYENQAGWNNQSKIHLLY